MKRKANFVLIHGIINAILPVIIVLMHNGFFGTVPIENAWKYVWVAVALVFVPLVSSLIGIVTAVFWLRKYSEKRIAAGLILSVSGLLLHMIFRFILKW